MLRAAAVAGALTVVAVELVAVATVHQVPPALPTHVVALALGVAVAYSAAASIFVQELLRGALRALTMLQGGAEVLLGATAVASHATGARPASATPLPWRGSQSSAPVGDTESAAEAPAMLASGYNRERHASSPIEGAPTQPVTPAGITGQDGASVRSPVWLPDNSLYAPQFARGEVFRQSAASQRPAAEGREARHEPVHPVHPLPAGISVRLPPLAEVLPSPALYAPWSVVPPIAEPSATTEVSTMAAREAVLEFQAGAHLAGRLPRAGKPAHGGRRPVWWPRRRIHASAAS